MESGELFTNKSCVSQKQCTARIRPNTAQNIIICQNDGEEIFLPTILQQRFALTILEKNFS